MRPHPELLYRAGAGMAGAVWGLALARLIAEAGFCAHLYSSAVAVVALACGFGVVGVSAPPLASIATTVPLLLYILGAITGPVAGGVLLAGETLFSLLFSLEERTGDAPLGPFHSRWRTRALKWLVPLSLGLVVLGLYLHTMLPSVGQADTFEFQVVVPRLAIAHPPGYPLYVLLGKLFTLLPLGNVAWRVNLASAVFATGAVLVLYGLVARLEWWAPALLAAMALAFSATFWSQAVVAEVYTLHTLLVAIALWLLLFPWEDTDRPPSLRWKVLAFVLGSGLAHHLTMALLLPTAILALIWERPRMRARDWPGIGGLFLLGLSLYLFIPLRWPALNSGRWMTAAEFFAYITGGQFHGALQSGGWRDPARWEIVWRILREPFGNAGLLLAAAGLICLALRRRRALMLTGVTFVAFVFYGLSYNVPDIAVFLLPAHLLLALWIGVGIAFLIGLVSRRRIECGRYLLAIVALLPLSRVWLNLPLVDRSRDEEGYHWGRYVMSLPLEQHSAVLADVEKFAPLYYLQQIEGARPDLDLVLLGSEELYYGEMHRRLETGQTVYLARYLPNLAGLYLRSVGPLVEVSQHAFDVPVAERGTLFGTKIRLLDTRLDRDVAGRPLYHLTLYWLADDHIDEDLVVRLQLVNQEGSAVWTVNGERPVGGLYPTNAWPMGMVLSDYHEVAPPVWVQPGEYHLEIGLFPRFGGTGLSVEGRPSSWLRAGILKVTEPSAPLPPLPYEVRYAFTDGTWLSGYHLAGETPAGASVAVELSWHPSDKGKDRDRTVRLSWVDAEGRESGFFLFPVAGPGVRSRHELPAPENPGDYRLHIGLVGEKVYCTWLASPMTDCMLAGVRVLPSKDGLANFAGLILLLDGEVGRLRAHPGDTIPVTLRWRGMSAMSENYTLSVQLIGPDGRLHGQVDMWPVAGTFPTSQWKPGLVVRDVWEVRLSPDAPPGEYRVEVAWYLLRTMRRLPLLDEHGRQWGDSFAIGRFVVER